MHDRELKLSEDFRDFQRLFETFRSQKVHEFNEVLHGIHELFEIKKSRKISESLGKSRKVPESFNSRSCT